MWGELSYKWGELSSECGASCLWASFLWGELSWGELSLGRVVRNPLGNYQLYSDLPLPRTLRYRRFVEIPEHTKTPEHTNNQ